MTPIEIERALAEIVIREMERCKDEISAVPKDNILERKNLAMIRGIYDMCLNGGLLWKADDRSNMLKLKSNRMQQMASKPGCDRIMRAIDVADSEELMKLTASLYGEMFMLTVADKYQAEKEYASSKDDIEGEYDADIKLKAVNSIISKWAEWRHENGVYPEIEWQI